MCMHKRAYTHSKRRRARERYKKQANPRSHRHTPNATLAKGYPSHSELVVEVALAHLLQLIPQQGGSGLVRSQRLKRGGWGVVLERPGKAGRLLREHAPRQRLCARLTLQCRAPTFQTRRGASRPPAYVRDTLEPCDLSEVSLPSCIRLVGEQHLQHVDVAFAGSEV